MTYVRKATYDARVLASDKQIAELHAEINRLRELLAISHGIGNMWRGVAADLSAEINELTRMAGVEVEQV